MCLRECVYLYFTGIESLLFSSFNDHVIGERMEGETQRKSSRGSVQRNEKSTSSSIVEERERDSCLRIVYKKGKHLPYNVQDISFACVLCVIFFLLQWIRINRCK